MSDTMDPRTALYQSDLLLDIGRTDDAEQLLRRALASHPHDADLHARLSTVLVDLERYPEAHAEALAGNAEGPSFEAWLSFARIAAHTGDSANAVYSCERMLEWWPHHPWPHVALALFRAEPFASKAAKQEVRDSYARGLALSRDPSLIAMAARAEEKLGDRDRARELVDQGLQEHPQHVDLLMLRSRLKSAPDERNSIYLSILAMDPMHAESRHALEGQVLAARGAAEIGVTWMPATLVAWLATSSHGTHAIPLLIAAVTGVLVAGWSFVLSRRVPASTVERLWPRAQRIEVMCLGAVLAVGLVLLALHSPVGPVAMVGATVVHSTLDLRRRGFAAAPWEPEQVTPRSLRNRMLLFAIPGLIITAVSVSRFEYGAAFAPSATAAALMFLQASMLAATLTAWTDARRTAARVGWAALTVAMTVAAVALTVTAVERSIGPERLLEPQPPTRSSNVI
ncbi:tetratricopeptide repeat protein [Aeromicrobium sp. Marseille-Q0843]|uniref:Tetratricopeptide repeat protein n=1 Tax=Aeromicrobium phoceense TaxID=2754045 RepID=A0A838XEI9_9ACTN|nr:tetratricopeptide repeat protein [Aeromicrobium phoceense]MBA4608322.1 tetratricopeptide repeat protein [Aeromicrobium phoceense]